MGWNSWNRYKCAGLNEELIKSQAAAMVASGMLAAGYEYVNLDDCWMNRNRDNQGNLEGDPQTFPSGIPALVGYIHGLGLKIGLYEDAGTLTCDGRPGSYGHYDQDAKTFANWGIDYIKVDWCHAENLDPRTQYTLFAQAMTNQNLDIAFSICDWRTNLPWEWAPEIANLWRTSPDIADQWLSTIINLDAASQFYANAGTGAWNDPDMLEVGNGGMSDTEDRTHFTMWAMLSAPLIASNDLTSMSAMTLATLTNPEVIAIDQDRLGKPGVLISDNGAGLQVWSKHVSRGTVVALLNTSATPSEITVNWGEIGLNPSRPVAVRDLWAATDLGEVTNSFSALVPSHGVTLVKLDAVSESPSQTVYEADAPGNILSGTASVQPCPVQAGYSCRDGYSVGHIGGGSGNSIEFNHIDVPSSGQYNILVYAATYPSLNFYVSVNGGSSTPVRITGLAFGVPVTSGLSVQLNAGANSILFSNPDALAPNLDHIVVSGPLTISPGFNFVYPGQNLTIDSAGQTGTATLNLVPIGGFTGEVRVTCQLPPAMLSATCHPDTVNLQAEHGAYADISISTRASDAAALGTPDTSTSKDATLSPGVKRGRSRRGEIRCQGTAPVGFVPVALNGLTPSTSDLFPVSAADTQGTSNFSSAIVVKTLPPPPETPVGTYPVTITATSGSLTRTTSMLVTVQ